MKIYCDLCHFTHKGQYFKRASNESFTETWIGTFIFKVFIRKKIMDSELRLTVFLQSFTFKNNLKDQEKKAN